MKRIVARDSEELSAIGVDIVALGVTANPAAVVGLTTGSTPVKLYGNLVARSSARSHQLEPVRIFCTEA